ncbi:MAG TPA: dolichyl-phosphate beta-glucosyltransferase [Thermoanaerobaculia bacterium]|nr:dolichyl-phosphate beta-glucosyltransferase [Thermoanaerobaculia bacterium]
MRLSVVVPAYNEERRLPATLARIGEYVASAGETGWEIVVVDDGSADRTAEAARAAGSAGGIPVEVVVLPANRGKGAAIREGVRRSRGERVLVSDADLSTPIEEWTKLRDAGAPLAIGSRAIDEATVRRRQAWYRRALGKVFNRIVRTLSVPGIRDTQCGFKLFDGAVARDLFAAARIDRFAWDVEILAIARARGIPIAEVPVLWFNSPESKVSVFRDLAPTVRDLLRIRLRMRREAKAARRTEQAAPRG